MALGPRVFASGRLGRAPAYSARSALGVGPKEALTTAFVPVVGFGIGRPEAARTAATARPTASEELGRRAIPDNVLAPAANRSADSPTAAAPGAPTRDTIRIFGPEPAGPAAATARPASGEELRRPGSVADRAGHDQIPSTGTASLDPEGTVRLQAARTTAPCTRPAGGNRPVTAGGRLHARGVGQGPRPTGWGFRGLILRRWGALARPAEMEQAPGTANLRHLDALLPRSYPGCSIAQPSGPLTSNLDSRRISGRLKF